MTAPAHRARAPASTARGGPLVMLALLIGGWCGARVMWWEDPFAQAVSARAPLDLALAAAPRPPPLAATALVLPISGAFAAEAIASPVPPVLPAPQRAALSRAPAASPLARLDAVLGLGPSVPADAGAPAAVADERPAPPRTAAPPFLPAPPPPSRSPGRWSLDGWAFWRQGSAAAPVSQGRVPIYGASQTGTVLQYRLAPSSRRDPRLYARAYRALLAGGESEAALGASLRPLGRVPLRLMGEVRYTDAAAFNAFRPAVLAVTEMAPLRLPYGAQLEAYAQGGWVGGPGATPFADGQASITRAVPLPARVSPERLRVSLGGGVWGGAQEDAQRLDLGPTLRIDARLGKVPARLTIDWRQRVAGEAAPASGVAATIATGF